MDTPTNYEPCLCGVPACLGHPGTIVDGKEYVYFTPEESQWLRSKFRRQKRQAERSQDHSPEHPAEV